MFMRELVSMHKMCINIKRNFVICMCAEHRSAHSVLHMCTCGDAVQLRREKWGCRRRRDASLHYTLLLLYMHIKMGGSGGVIRNLFCESFHYTHTHTYTFIIIFLCRILIKDIIPYTHTQKYCSRYDSVQNEIWHMRREKELLC